MKFNLTLVFACLLSLTVFSQEDKKMDSSEPKKELSIDEAEILEVVVHLFDGMRAGDSSIVRSCFHEQVEMFTSYTNKKGEAVFVKDDVQKFINAVGTPHEEVWDEKIWDTEIRVDGNLAQVWTKYGFYLDEKFSHCGVDAIHLTKTTEGWKIFHLSDTRQREGCEEK
ncbi:MAG: nuclear transport factor 2 family protein [Saprospiraceae bacterium]